MINPYEGYTIYGPYLHSVENRWYVQLVKPGHRTTTSYARYLMSMHLGRLLGADEEVDHIDNNKLNDSFDNLQILSKTENRVKAGRGRNVVTFICPNCGNTFTRESNRAWISPERKYPPCCSRSCAGKYQHNPQPHPAYFTGRDP